MKGPLDAFTPDRLDGLLRRFPGLRVAVLGDFCLDVYLEVDPALAQPSLETGRTAHQVVGVRHSPGAAGTVVGNLLGLGEGGIQVQAIGFTGDDGHGHDLRADLTGLGCDVGHLHLDPGRLTPAYLKPRDRNRPGLEGEHGRYDVRNQRTTTPDWMEAELLASLDAVLPDIDALVVMDQEEAAGSGAMTAGIVGALAARIAPFEGLVAWADSRRRIDSYRGVLVKMNQFELAGVPHPMPGSTVSDEAILEALPGAEARAGAPAFVTVAERGVWVGGPSPCFVPAVRVPGPVDPTGAGDAFTAGAVLSMAAGASRVEAALVGNLAASVTVRQLDTTGSPRPRDLVEAFQAWRRQNP